MRGTKVRVMVMLVVALVACGARETSAQTAGPTAAARTDVAVGSQYDSTHVYVAPGELDAFVNSVIATFGGRASKPSVTNVLPVPSSTQFQYVWTPVGTMSVFAYTTPIPFPFGTERTGYLVTDMDRAIAAARAAGAEVIVEPFQDPIGRDAVIAWPGGLKMQLYWHTQAPSYAPLETVPENRVYVSKDAADAFVAAFVKFSGGRVISDERNADAGEIGRPGETFRAIHITSKFGEMRVFVTDGHLPYPFGWEVTGYQVTNLAATLEKAKAAGARVLSPAFAAKDRVSAIVQFPGGFIAEIHSDAPSAQR